MCPPSQWSRNRQHQEDATLAIDRFSHEYSAQNID